MWDEPGEPLQGAAEPGSPVTATEEGIIHRDTVWAASTCWDLAPGSSSWGATGTEAQV